MTDLVKHTAPTRPKERQCQPFDFTKGWHIETKRSACSNDQEALQPYPVGNNPPHPKTENMWLEQKRAWLIQQAKMGLSICTSISLTT